MPIKSKAHAGPHKYKRVKWGDKGTLVWRCMLENCQHYLHAEMIENKQSRCWKCGRTFVMDKDRMQRVKPKCSGCIDHKDAITEQLDRLLKGL